MAQPTFAPVVVDCDQPTPADILRGAARYLRRYGWTRRRTYDLTTDTPFPPADVLGAISMAVHGRVLVDLIDNDLDGYVTWTEGVLDEDLDRAGHYHLDTPWAASIDAWNDAPGRTATDVIDTLRAAADDYELAPPGIRVAPTTFAATFAGGDDR